MGAATLARNGALKILPGSRDANRAAASSRMKKPKPDDKSKALDALAIPLLYVMGVQEAYRLALVELEKADVEQHLRSPLR